MEYKSTVQTIGNKLGTVRVNRTGDEVLTILKPLPRLDETLAQTMLRSAASGTGGVYRAIASLVSYHQQDLLSDRSQWTPVGDAKELPQDPADRAKAVSRRLTVMLDHMKIPSQGRGNAVASYRSSIARYISTGQQLATDDGASVMPERAIRLQTVRTDAERVTAAVDAFDRLMKTVAGFDDLGDMAAFWMQTEVKYKALAEKARNWYSDNLSVPPPIEGTATEVQEQRALPAPASNEEEAAS